MKKVIIIGAGTAAEMVAKDMLNNSKISKKYKLVGFLDDDPNKREKLGVPVLGTLSSLKGCISEHEIDEVIIAIPSATKETINKILALLSHTEAVIKIVPGIFEIVEGKVHFSQVRNIEPEDLLGREEVGFETKELSEYYKGKTVFVTGAGGSIGSELVAQLLNLPIERVVAFGHGENSIHSLALKHYSDKRFSFVIGDVRDEAKVRHELNRFKAQLVFHAAAHKHLPLMEDAVDEAVKNNIMATYTVAKESINSGVERFMLISTDKAVNPVSVMGATKRVAERIVSSLNSGQTGTSFAFTRFGNVLGSRGSVVPIFKEQIEKGGPVTVTDPEMSRYFMSIREAARLVVKSASIKDEGVFVLDMGKSIKIIDLVKNMIRLYGYDEDEIPIVFTGMRPGEKLSEEPLSADEQLHKSAYDKLFVSSENDPPLSEHELAIMLEEFSYLLSMFMNSELRELLKKYVPTYSCAKEAGKK